ncbi:Host cell surface-exposed lipoprotein [compost metagenome]
MHLSKAGIYDQLTSEYGEKFPAEAAQYAMDNLEFDWKENALKKAQEYAEAMSMSDADIYDQLISEYGEKFTKEEAQYAIDNLE